VECSDKYTVNYLAALLRHGWLMGRDYRPTVIGLSCQRLDDNVVAHLSASRATRLLHALYMKWLHFPMFDHHIAVSEHAAGELRAAARGHHVRRGVWVRPMGASCDLFHPRRRDESARTSLRRRWGAPDGSTLLVYAGRLAPQKNLRLLIDIIAELEQRSPGRFHLLVAGDGPMRAEFEHACDRIAPGSVSVLGFIADRETLAGMFANCDIFVHPNPREPFGIAPLEAMASGLALVAPDSGGVTSYADSTNSWPRPASATAFAGAITEIANRPDEAQRRRQEARRTAERFDWDVVTEGFFDLYDELHAVTRGLRKEPLLPPSFYSTPGNWRGPETHWEART
jgi:alpha-1,6-mannosyltransferase